jgi:hypothetical protein
MVLGQSIASRRAVPVRGVDDIDRRVVGWYDCSRPWPARSPPQLTFGFDQTIATADWPEMDQTAGQQADGWE